MLFHYVFLPFILLLLPFLSSSLLYPLHSSVVLHCYLVFRLVPAIHLDAVSFNEMVGKRWLRFPTISYWDRAELILLQMNWIRDLGLLYHNVYKCDKTTGGKRDRNTMTRWSKARVLAFMSALGKGLA